MPLKKKNLPPLLPGLKPEIFRSRVGAGAFVVVVVIVVVVCFVLFFSHILFIIIIIITSDNDLNGM